jgi:hypothetical protein
MEAIEISTKPHHNALTEASRSHFPSIHDALAELIDNSIQACEGNSADAGRRVHIGCFLSEEKFHGFLTVMDNGCGMDEKTLTEFSTLALDRATRNLQPTADLGSTSISRFGVGAKQASFYLGTRLRVITKCKVRPPCTPSTARAVVFQPFYPTMMFSGRRPCAGDHHGQGSHG